MLSSQADEHHLFMVASINIFNLILPIQEVTKSISTYITYILPGQR